MDISRFITALLNLHSIFVMSMTEELTLGKNKNNTNMIPTEDLQDLGTRSGICECAVACLSADGCISVFYLTYNNRCYGYKYIVTDSTRMTGNGKLVHYEKLFEKKCSADGFTMGDGICFRIFPERKTWIDANNHCKTFGGHLIILSTIEKYTTFIKYVTAYNVVWNYFIGLSDIDEEGKMVWLDGTPDIDYGIWKTNQPDNIDMDVGLPVQNNADCVVMTVKNSRPTFFQDDYCLKEVRYICEVT